MGWDGGGGVIPAVDPGPVISGTFPSAAPPTSRPTTRRHFPAKLAGIDVLIDGGTDDPFAPQAETMRNLLSPPPAGGMSRGAHTDRYMTRVAPEQMTFLAQARHRS